MISPSTEEIADFYQMYSRVEAVLARLAAQRHESGEADDLLRIAKEIRSTNLYTFEKRLQFIRGISAYHRQMGLMAHSPTLISRIDGLRRISDFYLWQGDAELRPETTRQMNSMHIKIAEAIKVRNIEEVEALMEEHIRMKPRQAGILKHAKNR